MKQPHIAVVGAGALGSWTAYYLKQRGAKVTLLDAWGPGNSRSSSGGETRVIRSVYGPDEIYVKMVAKAFPLWKEFEQKWEVRCYTRTGCLWMINKADDSYLKTSLPHLKKFGFPIEKLNWEELSKRFPQINSQGVLSAYLEKEAGFLRANKACRLVCEAFVKSGGDYRLLAAHPGRVEQEEMAALQLSDGTKLQADHYVFACGPWLKKIFPELLDHHLTISRQEVYYFGISAGNASLSYPALPCWVEFGEHIYYGIPGAGNRGFKIADDTRKATFDPDKDDRLPTFKDVETARSYLAFRFPKLAKAPLLEARVCQYTNCADGNYLIDRHPQAENVWIAGAGGGHAFKMGPALGTYLADLILENKKIDPFFSFRRMEGIQEMQSQLFKQKKA